LITILTMLLRRAPQRVTPNPLWWLLALVATYGPLTWSVFAPTGRPVIPAIATDVLAVVSILIVIYARLSLGRNIGFVPAQRELVRSGAYAYVRHPIYSGLILAWTALALRVWSPLNVALVLTFVTLIVIKSIVEEGFLRADPAYAEYMRLVKHRFVPGLA
jgi:protein-S-isoprenylcysteine O-methyltransferase Ste14